MRYELKMPRLGPDMDEGTLIKWNVSVDDEVEEGAVLASIESDKSEVDLESRWHGVVAELVVEAGTVVPVGGVIAVLYEPGTDPRPLGSSEVGSKAIKPTSSDSVGARRKISPLVRRLLETSGLSADDIEGTGPGGLIQRSDVESAINKTDDPLRFVLSKTEKTAGRRMAESRSTIPDFAISRRVDMSAALVAKNVLADRGSPVSLNDMILFATARALIEHPRVNGVFEGDAVVARPDADISLAISAPDGLVAATLPQCQLLDLVELGSKSRELAERVRIGKLRPEDLDQGSFTVSNLGMYGVDRFQPIINPPHVAIMGVGRMASHVALDPLGVPISVPMIELTVVADHRAVDGVALASFLASVENHLTGDLA